MQRKRCEPLGMHSLLAVFLLYQQPDQMSLCSERSKQLNNTRIKVLQAREDAVQHVVKESQAKLADISKDPKKYKTLLVDLIVQVSMHLAPEYSEQVCILQHPAPPLLHASYVRSLIQHALEMQYVDPMHDQT